MSFDLEKLQAVADLGEVIRLQNEALERLQAFRKARPYMVMPNLVKVVEENLKENLQVLYKEFNNLHKPQEQQIRYICNECKMAFLVKLPGGICDECRVKLATKPRNYVLPEVTDEPEEVEAIAEVSGDEAAVEDNNEEIAADVENAAAGDKAPVEVEQVVAEESAKAEQAEARTDTEGMSDEFERFLSMAGGSSAAAAPVNEKATGKGAAGEGSDKPEPVDDIDSAEGPNDEVPGSGDDRKA